MSSPATYILLKTFYYLQKKPYSAVTVQIDRLTSEQYDENDLAGIVDLVEVIRIQESGPTEAARAIRKKLKYGSVHRQLRALTILDGLIQNAGPRFQRAFADEPLLERLRILARDDMVDPDVRAKCNVLFRQWAVAYKGKPGLERIAALYKQLPQTRRPQPHQSKVIKETEADADSTPSSPITESRPSRSSSSAATSSTKVSFTPAAPVSTSSSFFSHKEKKHKKSKSQPFNLEKEKPKMMETIAAASVASTNLLNALQLINREQQRVSENPGVVKLFDSCKQLRRQILRYIQLVESDQWIGSLLSANDELVKALMSFEIMDKSISDDSDSETEGHAVRSPVSPSSPTGPATQQLAGLNLGENPPPKPPRPVVPAFGKQRAEESESEPEEEDDDDNPFADKNAVKTPYAEPAEMRW
ncbi:VHS domain-containing protein [Botryosphaeria dothidea]|uniref:VHS domain-containing protein n=1 Tax=Botryosphaeria dothidea TaxID=55169 RepID=A0A8H4N9U7_9PEZI|nr:VHS domain-containing protein [Botryosphaeria dothidea]